MDVCLRSRDGAACRDGLQINLHSRASAQRASTQFIDVECVEQVARVSVLRERLLEDARSCDLCLNSLWLLLHVTAFELAHHTVQGRGDDDGAADSAAGSRPGRRSVDAGGRRVSRSVAESAAWAEADTTGADVTVAHASWIYRRFVALEASQPVRGCAMPLLVTSCRARLLPYRSVLHR